MRGKTILTRPSGAAAVLALFVATVMMLSAPASASGPGDNRYVYTSSDWVTQAQGILEHDGYLARDSYKSGKWDNETIGAIRAFQAMHTMPTTGQLDSETMAELLSHASAYDVDRDGITDNLDLCPDTPFGVRVDTRGCPGDDDNDTIANSLDRCPDTPAGTRVDADGCPLETT